MEQTELEKRMAAEAAATEEKAEETPFPDEPRLSKTLEIDDLVVSTSEDVTVDEPELDEELLAQYQLGFTAGVQEAFKLVMSELQKAKKSVHDPKGYGLRALMKFETGLFSENPKNNTPVNKG